MAKTEMEIITELLKDGAKSEVVNVKNVKVKTYERYTRVRLTTDKDVDGYVEQDDKSYKLDKTNVVFIGLFNLVNALRDTDYDVVIDHICDHPQSAVVLFKNAKLTLVEQQVKKGDTVEGATEPAEHDCIYWHCQKVEFSEFAQNKLNEIIDKMLGL